MGGGSRDGSRLGSPWYFWLGSRVVVFLEVFEDV